ANRTASSRAHHRNIFKCLCSRNQPLEPSPTTMRSMQQVESPKQESAMNKFKAFSRTLLISVSLLTCTMCAAQGGGQVANSNETERGRWEQCADVPWRVQEVYGAARDGKVIIAGGMSLADDGTVRALDRTGI